MLQLGLQMHYLDVYCFRGAALIHADATYGGTQQFPLSHIPSSHHATLRARQTCQIYKSEPSPHESQGFPD